MISNQYLRDEISHLWLEYLYSATFYFGDDFLFNYIVVSNVPYICLFEEVFSFKSIALFPNMIWTKSFLNLFSHS